MKKKSLYSRLIIIATLVLMMAQPVLAEETSAADGGQSLSDAAYNAAAEAAAEKDQIIWKVPVAGKPVKSADGVMVSPAGNPEAEAPKLKAKGAALYSFDLGKVVFGKNEDTRLEPYSTTKLLTCWLALQNLNPDDIVTVSKDATQAYENGTTIWLKEGEKIPVRDLLYGAMLESGNDAAYALGEAVAGSEFAFAELMNNTAADWGCKDTHFVNANGWKNEEHYTTARDMAVITAKCLESAELREISMTKKYTAPATNLSGAREMKNYLLHVTDNPDGMTGGKTGTWEEDDCAVVVSFSSGGLEAAAVVLGDTEKGRPADIRKLMAFAHEVTPGFIVPAAGSPVETAWVRHGEKTRTVLAADTQTYAYPASNKAEDIRTEVKYDKLEAPVKKGEVVGDFLVYTGDRLIGEHKLIATENIDTGWFPSYIYISNKATLNALKVLAAFVALLILVSLIAGRRKKKRKKNKRKKRTKAAADRPQKSSDANRKAYTGGRESPNKSGNIYPVSTLREDRIRKAAEAQNTYERNSAGSDGTRRSSGASPKRSSSESAATGTRSSSRKNKKEARRRLREKYRNKH